QQDADLGVEIDQLQCHEFSGGTIDTSIGALDHLERQTRQAQRAPASGEVFGTDRVQVEVHGAQLIWCQSAGVLSRTKSATITGTTTMMTHAPCMNLVEAIMIVTNSETIEPAP